MLLLCFLMITSTGCALFQNDEKIVYEQVWMEFPLSMIPDCPAFPYKGNGSIDSVLAYNGQLLIEYKSCRVDVEALLQYVIERNMGEDK